ncbi:MAG: flippase [Thiohalomonadales bacterium]
MIHKRLLVSITNYSMGNLLFSIAGLISFPILTRLLTVEDYGLLALIGVTLTFIVALSKGGLQHSALRFYSETKEGGKEWSLDNYYATVLFGMGFIGIITTLLWLLFSQLAPRNLWNNDLLPYLFGLTSILILTRVLDSVLVNIIRAKELTALFNVYRVAKRYFTLSLVLIVLFLISRDLIGFFVATIIVEISALLVLSYYVFHKKWPRLTEFSPRLLKVMLLFGIPMLGYELAGIVLNVGDRYIIQWYMGASALGPYAAAYNLTEMVHGIVVVAFAQAVMPMYLRMWSEKGEKETQEFISRSLYYYFLISLPIIAGLSAIGPELLQFLASEKYAEGSIIIPYVITGLTIDGTIVLVGAGLYIRKQSKYLMLLVAASAIINAILNFILIPIYGIEGAAIATLISYFALAFFTFLIARKSLQIKIPCFTFLKFSFVSYAMYILVSNIEGPSLLSTMFLQIVGGVVFYIIAILAVDRQARTAIRELLIKFQN